MSTEEKAAPLVPGRPSSKGEGWLTYGARRFRWSGMGSTFRSVSAFRCSSAECAMRYGAGVPPFAEFERQDGERRAR
jgi:hypothetical protein